MIQDSEVGEQCDLEQSRVKLFSDLIKFASEKFTDVRTIEWEEIIYFKNMILTPMMMGTLEE